MATYQVKLSKRYALRLLRTHDCRVKLEKGCEKGVDENAIYTTRCSGFISGSSFIWCYELKRYIDYENIVAIEHQATRFRPDLVFEQVDWN